MTHHKLLWAQVTNGDWRPLHRRSPPPPRGTMHSNLWSPGGEDTVCGVAFAALTAPIAGTTFGVAERATTAKMPGVTA